MPTTNDKTQRPTLFLLDAMALIYRAYYAFLPQKLASKAGVPTGAIYGFIKTLHSIIEQYKPDYLAVATDAKEKTFRHDAYVLYKANRPEPPEDLIQQLDLIYKLIEGYGVTLIKLPGYEADDIIGTLAKRYAQECDVYIITPDKDFSQLVDGNIKILKPSKDDDKFELYDREQVRERYGVYPERFVDMLALMGDSSDNIPGVAGVGPKTAANLINEYGTVENLYQNISRITKYKMKQNLLDAKEDVKIAKFLVTIKTDAPVEIPLSELRVKPPNVATLAPILEELEMKQFLSKLKAERAALASESSDEDDETSFNFGANVGEDVSLVYPHSLGEYHFIATPEAFESLLADLKRAEEFAFDTETTSLDALNAELVCVSFAIRPHQAFCVRCLGDELPLERALSALKPILENPAQKKIAQNAKYDYLVLKRYGIETSPISFDAMLASYVLNPDDSHNLSDIAMRLFNYRLIEFDELVGAGKNQVSIKDVPPDKLARYACQDADVTLQAKHRLAEKLAESPALQKVFEEIEMPLLPVLARMEWEGVAIDTSILSDISAALETEIAAVSQSVYQEAGATFNIDSTKQLAEILFEKMGLPVKKRTKTGVSTDARVLEELAEEFPIASKILEYRSLQKLKSTYVDALPAMLNPKTKRAHTSFNQTIAATGRLSSSNPNLQNIPIRTEVGRQIRKAFIPSEKGRKLLSADYSQIELRIAAELSGDETMLEAFKNGEDIHAATARVIFGVQDVSKEQRRKAKEVNFGVLYGIQPFGLAQRLDIPQSEAKSLIENYKQKYPKIFEYMERVLRSAKTLGYVETMTGRRRYFPNIHSKNFSIRNAAERAAINAPIQGTAADMIKLAMIQIDRDILQRGFRSRMILQVHDELLFDIVPSEQEELSDLVKSAMLAGARKVGITRVPIVVEIGVGENWLMAH
ncbi:MAG: DNA polymerase I [Chloroherpetonaceae bacterium]|nr:DNA polymerase I [Chloroherpetonaceae bacterium]MDW8436790.1 DNA polymerase I [Chloroherpetonaceae bacterium]